MFDVEELKLCHDKLAFLPGGCLGVISGASSLLSQTLRNSPSDNAASTLRSPDLEGDVSCRASSCQVRARCAHIKVTEKASTTLYSYVQLVRTCSEKHLSLIHISEPTRLLSISYAV